jgi:L-lactate dehydrogenase complex protein LldG
MSSRERILRKLRGGARPFPDHKPPADYLPVVPRGESRPAGLRELFIREAEKAACVVHTAATPAAAIAIVLEIIGVDEAICSWDPAQIPLPGLAAALAEAGIAHRGMDAKVRVGLTGVDAALAATGSVLVGSGDGRDRAPSLVPLVHIAVLTADQILPDLESWWAAQKKAGLAQARRRSNLVVITGPSRTADIAMQLVMGMHGPQALHLVLVG